MEFRPYGKTERFNGFDVTISEKIDGTNACIAIEGDTVLVQSRNRVITPESDNYGFAGWVERNKTDIVAALGHGYHYGEWAGPGIQDNRHQLTDKTFFLFNTSRPPEAALPHQVRVVPVLYRGYYSDRVLASVLDQLEASRQYKPEGVIIYFHNFRLCQKYTLDGNQSKWTIKERAHV